MAAAIIGLFIWIFLTESSVVGDSLLVSVPAVILAGATAVVSLVSYIWTPKNLILPFALTAYLLLAATIAALIIGTGGLSSPFIALWMLIVVFAGVFGLWGLIPILAAIGTFAGFEYVANNLSTDSIVIIGFSGILPLIASFIVWHSKVGGPKEDSNPDSKAYRNLANELTEVASKSEVVINAIGDGVMAIDSQGIIQLINPAAQRIIGWGKQDALALNYKSVLQLVNGKNEPLDAAGDPIQQVLNTNQQIRTNDLTLITKSTKKLMISLVVSPVGDAGSGVIVVFRDITKEKAEEREQAEFISTASHEMRTPVASIEGYLGLAMNPTTATVDQRAHDYIMKAHESAQHLGRLFQDLLDVSKATDGRLSNIPKVVDVTKFVFDVV
ncbi:MAG TPA: PAS domain-containing protein, partial [Candidatus Saccharibacteria bacterium]|nr:PAS domain-containing protein [Candidatus Saccharibacteria bacterium]